MKLFLVSLAVCIGAVAASGGLSLPRCSKTVEECLGGYEVIHLNKVEKGEKCVYSVTIDIFKSHPAFTNAFIKLESSPKGSDHTQVVFTRRDKTNKVVKTTTADVCEPASSTSLFSDVHHYPNAEDYSNMITIRCVKGCDVYLSYHCNPKDGPIVGPTLFIWSASKDAKTEHVEECKRIASSMGSKVKFIDLAKV